ncbi:MAG: hypothetical protein ACOYJB_06440 [Christensenellaceae bacterium]|jgi:hypothetical protein
MLHYFISKKIDTLLLSITSQCAYIKVAADKTVKVNKMSTKEKEALKQELAKNARNSLESVMQKSSSDIYARYRAHRDRSSRVFEDPFREIYYDTYIAFLKKAPKDSRIDRYMKKHEHLLGQYFS